MSKESIIIEKQKEFRAIRLAMLGVMHLPIPDKAKGEQLQYLLAKVVKLPSEIQKQIEEVKCDTYIPSINVVDTLVKFEFYYVFAMMCGTPHSVSVLQYKTPIMNVAFDLTSEENTEPLAVLQCVQETFVSHILEKVKPRFIGVEGEMQETLELLESNVSTLLGVENPTQPVGNATTKEETVVQSDGTQQAEELAKLWGELRVVDTKITELSKQKLDIDGVNTLRELRATRKKLRLQLDAYAVGGKPDTEGDKPEETTKAVETKKDKIVDILGITASDVLKELSSGVIHLAVIRQLLDCTQTEMAALLGIPRGTYQGWEYKGVKKSTDICRVLPILEKMVTTLVVK